MAAAREKRAEELIDALAKAKVAQAMEFLTARIEGTEIGGGRATVEDARMSARKALSRKGIEDPEIIRWRLTALLGSPVSGDE